MFKSRGAGISIHCLSTPASSSLADRVAVRSLARMHASTPAFTRTVVATTSEDTVYAITYTFIPELSLADISVHVCDAVRVQKIEALAEYEDLKAQLLEVAGWATEIEQTAHIQKISF